MKLEFRDGLIFTSIHITYRGVVKEINNIVIDTGAAETIISPDKEIGIVSLGKFNLNNTKIDFGVIDPRGLSTSGKNNLGKV